MRALRISLTMICHLMWIAISTGLVGQAVPEAKALRLLLLLRVNKMV